MSPDRQVWTQRLALRFDQNCSISLWFFSGVPMNDAPNGQVVLLVSHDAVILLAVQISLIRLRERRLAEDHLTVLGYLQPMGPTESGCI